MRPWTLMIVLGILSLVPIFPGSTLAQMDGTESRLIEVINRARAERNQAPLRFEPRLTQIAREMAQAIYQGQKLDALSAGLETLLQQRGYPYMRDMRSFPAFVACSNSPRLPFSLLGRQAYSL